MSGQEADPARFAAALEQAAGGPVERLALAVSGGSDSMALLLLAHAAMPARISAATVDHRLRVGSEKDGTLVAATCAELGVPHVVLVPEAPIAGASLQAQAREARYALLTGWARGAGADCLATAHQADDQAETFLMRAARGSGLSGLAGIRARNVIHGFPVIRPLLEWRRAELRAIVRRAGAGFVDDPANADFRHDRTRFRALLEREEWLGAANLAASAAHLAEADADVRAMTDWLWGERSELAEDECRVTVDGLPRELRRRLVRRAIADVRALAAIETPAWSEAAGIEPLLDALEAGRGATRGGVQGSVRGGQWRFRAAPPRRAG
jgi:tRNA(Ile)-lysidine synthase